MTPQFDLPGLTQPMAAVYNAYGTGTVGDRNPTQPLTDAGTVLRTSLRVGSDALDTLGGAWQGPAAQRAADKGHAAHRNGADLVTQGAQQQDIFGRAAATVHSGATRTDAVLTTLNQNLAAIETELNTPAGQNAQLTLTINAMQQTAAIASDTRSQLALQTAEMTVAGQRLAVTQPPTPVASAAYTQAAASPVTPAQSSSASGSQQAQTIAQSLSQFAAQAQSQTTQQQLLGKQTASETETTPSSDHTPRPKPEPRPNDPRHALSLSGIPFAAAGFAGGTGPFHDPEHLDKRTLDEPKAQVLPAEVAEVEPAAEKPAGPSAPGMMPMGGAAGAVSADRADPHNPDARKHLITLQHGKEVVGEIAPTTLPVVGAVPTAALPLEKDFVL